MAIIYEHITLFKQLSFLIKTKLNFFYIKMDTVRQSLLSKKRRADRNGFNSRFTRGRFASHLEYKFFLNPERTSHYCLVLGSNIGFFFILLGKRLKYKKKLNLRREEVIFSSFFVRFAIYIYERNSKLL